MTSSACPDAARDAASDATSCAGTQPGTAAVTELGSVGDVVEVAVVDAADDGLEAAEFAGVLAASVGTLVAAAGALDEFETVAPTPVAAPDDEGPLHPATAATPARVRARAAVARRVRPSRVPTRGESAKGRDSGRGRCCWAGCSAGCCG
ncbi:hypothetical protein GCM10009868_40050 [Terrabacter aerolatus]|uniref:Uncharacterized protein n=1 Tax=Terrabacter aerolatus TaxID=422442 RepID=A0A512D071_9MICO|nr:hypothetical protein TAE01_16720 [Terrabacter aerolatus]